MMPREDEMKRAQVLLVMISAVALLLLLRNLGEAASKVKTAENHDTFAGAAPAGGNFVLVAHGGAGSYGGLTPEQLEARREAMIKAIRKGYGILASGGSSLDAVEATIEVMEDSG